MAQQPQIRLRTRVLRVLGRMVQWLLLLALLLLAIPVLLTGVIRSPAVRDRAKHEVAGLLARELQLGATISDLDLSPLTFSLVARSVSLDHPSEGRLLDAAELRIRPSLRALLLGKLDLNYISVDHATLFLKLRDGELVNGPHVPKSGPSGDELDLPFNIFDLRHARVLLDAGTDGSGEVADINVEIDASEDSVIAVDAHIGAGHLKHARGEEILQHFTGRAELRGGKRLVIEHLSVATQDASASVQRAELSLPPDAGPYAGQAEVSVHLPAIERIPGAEGVPALRGDVKLKADLRGEGRKVTGTAHVALRRVYIDQFGLGDEVTLDANAAPDGVAFKSHFAAIDDGGGLDLQGKLGLSDSLPLSVKATARSVEFGKLMKQLGVSDNAIVNWLISGRFELSGTAKPFVLRGPMHFDTRDFQITKGAFHERPQENILHFDRALLDGGIKVTEAGIFFLGVDAKLPRSRLEIEEVLLGFDNSLRVKGQGVEIDLRDLTPLVDFELDGQGTFDVQVAGEYTSPTVKGSANFKRFSFGGFPFGDIVTKYGLEKESQAVRFTEVAIRKGESRYHTESLLLDFTQGDLLVESRLHLDALWMEDFYKIFHYDDDERFESYQGLVKGVADLRYSLGAPGDRPSGTLTADLDLTLPEVELDGYRFTDGEFQGRFHWYDHTEGYQGAVLTVDRLAMRKGKGTVSLSGQMKRGGLLDLVVVGDRMAIKDTEGIGERLPALSGTYGIIGAVKGVVSAPRANLDVVGTDLRYQGVALGESRAYLRLTDRTDPYVVEAEAWQGGPPSEDVPCGHARYGFAHGTWPSDPPIKTSEGPMPALDQPMAFLVCGSLAGGQVQVDMTVGRTEKLPLRGRVTMSDFAYGGFLPKGADRKPLRGQVSGIVHLTGGGAFEPSTLEGRVALSDLRAGQFDVQLRNDGPIVAEFGEGRLQVDRAVLRGPSSQLSVHGGGSVEHGLSVTVDGDLDLSLLSHLGQTVSEVQGRLSLQFRVVGPVDAPAVFGNAEIHDAGLRLGSFPAPISSVNGRIQFSEQRIALEGFSARALGGALAIGGFATLSGRGLGSYRLDVEASGMSYRPRDKVSLRFGGRTQLAWRDGDRLPKLTGVMRVDEARYGRDIQVGRSIQDMYRKERVEVSNYRPEDDLLAIDLRVTESQPLRIQNNLIDAELVLDNQKQAFRVVGTDQRFGVLGNMSVKRGTLRFRDTAFVIRDGEFHFDDPTHIDPSFDLRAVTDVRRSGPVGQNIWHISLHAWGNREDVRFDLASDPRLTEDDIALLLTLGMTHAELAQLNAGDLTGTAALEALATVTGVEREVQRALPTIDDFRVQSAYSQRSNRTEPQLYIGKRIADRVRLSAATGVGAARDFRTGVELQVSDQTSVQAAYNNQNATGASQLGDVGVDFKWRLEFD